MHNNEQVYCQLVTAWEMWQKQPVFRVDELHQSRWFAFLVAVFVWYCQIGIRRSNIVGIVLQCGWTQR